MFPDSKLDLKYMAMNFLEKIEKDKEVIESELEKYFKNKIKNLPCFGNYSIKQQHQLLTAYCLKNGKRLRPILTLMAYRSVGGQKEKDILVPALAFELYHNYTLVHDDIYDEDEYRRGEPANHILLQQWFEKKYKKNLSENILFKNNATRFGAVAGIINGKYLHTLSGLAILEADIPEKKKVAGMILHQSVSIFDNTGQAMDLYFEQEKSVTEKDYFNMVLCKTGQLFKSAVEWGAILGDASQSQRNALSRYMEEAAIVFQLQDDILDISTGCNKGREIGSDIRKGKKTLLMIHALKKATAKEQECIWKILGDEKATDAEVKKVIATLKKLGSVAYCKENSSKRLKKAIKYLDEANPKLDQEAKKFFIDLAHFMLNRTN